MPESNLSYTLTYFDFPGRGEPVRLAFAIGGIPFENRTVTGAEFAAMKSAGELPYGSVPVLDIHDGENTTRVAQHVALLRYVGRLAGLYPTDPIEALKVDEATYFADEFGQCIFAAMAPMRYGFAPYANDEEKAAMRQRLAAEVLPKLLAKLNTIIEGNGSGFVVGPSITIADLKWYFHIGMVLSGFVDDIPPALFDDHPHVKNLYQKVRDVPEVRAWYEAEASRKASA